jgi:hypothetical protein
MSEIGKYITSQVLKGLDLFSPSESTEKLVFRKFNARALMKAVKEGQNITGNEADIDKVVLRVNPATLGFQKRKIITKVQTSAPGRFVVFDWGSELTVLSIQGNTGNLLPDSITQGNPISGMLQDATSVMTQVPGVPADAVGSVSNFNAALQGSGVGAVSAMLQNAMMNSMTYFEMLNSSPKYLTFKKLENMFDDCDADRDILTLEIGNVNIYRGFFEEFNFDVSADNPWNWKYSVVFVILDDLLKPKKRWDDQYKTSGFVVDPISI